MKTVELNKMNEWVEFAKRAAACFAEHPKSRTYTDENEHGEHPINQCSMFAARMNREEVLVFKLSDDEPLLFKTLDLIGKTLPSLEVHEFDQYYDKPKTDMEKLFDDALDVLVSEHNLAVENLTKSALIELLKQMILSGDIMREVSVMSYGGKQHISYVPYRALSQVRDQLNNSTFQLDAYRRLADKVMDMLKEGRLDGSMVPFPYDIDWLKKQLEELKKIDQEL